MNILTSMNSRDQLPLDFNKFYNTAFHNMTDYHLGFELKDSLDYIRWIRFRVTQDAKFSLY